MQYYINLVKEQKIIGTSCVSSDYNYTKMDLIKYLKMDNNIELLIRPQMQACSLLMQKCDIVVKLFNEMYEIASNNYNFLDDSPSIEKNYAGFIEHRHDQSILSLLVKKYNLINYDLDPTFWGLGLSTIKNYLNAGITYPIWTCRNRSGESFKNI
jgi:hypothetical protein